MNLKFTGIVCSVFWLLLMLPCGMQAQVFEGSEADARLRGAEVLRIHEISGSIQYAALGPEMQIARDQIQGYFRKVYKLDDAYGFEIIRSETDELGYTHIRYQLTFQHIPISGSVLIAHMLGGRLKSFNGEVFTIVPQASFRRMSEEECLRIALDSVHAESYLWEYPEEEAIIKEIKEDPKASWYPSAKLCYAPEGLNFNGGRFYLSYQFNIHGAVPRTAENIYIRADNGSLLARENMLHTGDVPGTAVTKYSGSKSIISDSTAPFNYRLRENTRGNGIYTFNMKKGTNYGAAVDFTDSNNYWNNINLNKDEVATDAHWGAETTYDYFFSKFNRKSFNNNNARINSYVHYANNYDNAFWDGFRMTYGDGNTFKPLTCLDVCGHEIAHAVTTYSANLVYSYESGQLNESFSDIFGNAIERYGKPNGYSWKIGEEITSTGAGLRNMQDPRLRNHPRCYKGTNWYYGPGDNGGVHLNSGVQNWWFYLITEGGSGLNDFSNAYKVDSLGILSAEKIAYRNLTVYLTPTSQYSDARFYSIQSAKDLFGNCSKEVISVTNAWYACNVGPKYDSGFVKAAFTADTLVCSTSKTVQFRNLSVNASTCKWYFGDNDTSTQYNPVHSYGSYGNFTVKLVVKSCFKNRSDSLVRTAYVKVDSTFDICNAILMPASGYDTSNRCSSFVYDDGGEDIYKQLRKSNLYIYAPGADSIRIRFFDFDYELNYDSLYIYRGPFPGGVKIGGYTGSVLPNGGNPIVVPGSMVTLRHISDPYVIGRGFKLFYTAFKKPVDLTLHRDTAICYGQSTLLYATGSGGYSSDYRFDWKGLSFNDSVVVSPLSTTVYQVSLRDVCTGSSDSASVQVIVRPPLALVPPPDTTICLGNTVSLSALATGGDSLAYTFAWDQGLGSGAVKTVAPLSTTTYRVVVSDACTPLNDTAYVTVFVREALRVQIQSNDTLICFNKTSALSASGSGGDSSAYNFLWSNGLGMGRNVMAMLNQSAWIKVELSDACSADPARDSLYVVVRAPLALNLTDDSAICNGSSVLLNASLSGGNPAAYMLSWNQGLSSDSTHSVAPYISTLYKVTLSDQCSDPVSDSVRIDLLGPVQISGLRDTTICVGMQVPLKPVVSGGLRKAYTYTWNFGLSSDSVQTVSPTGTNTYRVIVNDGCTVPGDTAYAVITVRSPLRAEISSNDTQICYNKNSALTVNGYGGLSSQYDFSWSHGLGNGNSKNISLTENTWIKVSLSDGCTVQPATDSLLLRVRTQLRVSLPADTLICYGTALQLNAIAGGGDSLNYRYFWNSGLSAQASHNISPLFRTVYTVTLQDSCSDAVSDTVTVDVMPALRIDALRDTTICYGGTASFTPVVSGGIAAQRQFFWDQGLGSNKDLSIRPLNTNTYTLIVSDQCSKPSDTARVRVVVRPALSLNASLSDRSICLGDSVMLSLNFSGGIPAQYSWTVNGQPETRKNLLLKPIGNTLYNLTLSDNCSTPDSSLLNLIVNTTPVADFSTARVQVCRDEPVSFSNLSSGASRFTWYFTPSDSSLAQAPVFRYKTPGSFNVVLKAVSDSGCVSSIVKNGYIQVIELPLSRFAFLPNEPDYLNRNVQFSNQSLHYSSFEWDFGDMNKESLNSDPEHTYPDTGRYRVSLITRNSIGCADTMVQLLRVKDVFRVFFPDAISMNGDQVNDSFVIKGRGIETYNLKVFNRWGEMIYNGSMGDRPFDGRDTRGEMLMKGTYLIQLTVRDIEGYMHYYRQMLEIL